MDQQAESGASEQRKSTLNSNGRCLKVIDRFRERSYKGVTIGLNFYKISEYNGLFYAYKVDVGLWNADRSIGKVSSLTDALALIKSHSGKEIKEIR